jgi:DNA adenine methylase
MGMEGGKVTRDAPKRPALRYYGGKWKLAPWIISFFPPHQNYVEPCGGAASVLLQKPRSPLETYNDLDGNVVNFFRVLRDRPDELIRKIRLTPWARAEYELSWHIVDDSVENARRFFICSWMAISNMALSKHTGFRTASFRDQCYSTHVGNFYALVDSNALRVISDRLRGIQLESRGWEYTLNRYDHLSSLIYFDPPYVKSERTDKDRYVFEWTDTQHIESAHLLRQAQGYVIVSGYACPLYAELYEDHDWARFDKEAQTNSGGKRIESVWLSPRTLEVLGKHEQQALF